MDYITKFSKNTSVLTIIVTGKYNRPQDAKILQQYMMEFCKENDCRKILVNLKDAVLVGTTLDIFNASTMPGDPDHNLLKSKIALLYKRITEDQRFVENVAFNRGYYNVHVFDNDDDAMEWLLPTEEQISKKHHNNNNKKI